MTTKNAAGSFDIILGMEDIGGRSNICLTFGAGLFRKLGWSSGDWLQFDVSREGFIAFSKIPEPSETSFYAKKIKLVSGFYKICFYSKLYTFPKNAHFAKDKATFNLETRTLTLEIPNEYCQQPEEAPQLKPIQELNVEDIAAAFRKL
ncbi:MAG: hypothetical protein PHE17_11665 [Thiothrix sp.]|uniref:hypothetical protein n=1 Tax=Thiothrix sp. TaxID=1032 RepID=UPI00260A2E1A|nr:hypothetical protein [Thiothrix sp.]MDD5393665.1 hypothetical protein [Thiothrix sp.]